ncbi:MAG: Hsp20/alpha crystallin family protein [Pseudorhodoplanes sp.]|nr:Hsp20/alpha crystallin family protein [Pseudorhodoplanes sp.]
MAETATKLPVKTGERDEAAPQMWHPFETLRRQIDRLFEDFGPDLWRAPFARSTFDVEPFWRRDWALATTPAVDIVEKDNAFELTADLPGMDEKNIEVKVSNGTLTIKGEKQEEKEEKKKDYYLKERRFGSFERSFRVPDSVAADKIEAQFKKGVLTVTLPKTAEAQKPAKKIEVKAA